MLPNPATLQDWVKNYAFGYESCTDEKEAQFEAALTDFIDSKKDFETLSTCETNLFGSNKMSFIIKRYTELISQPSSISLFSSLTDITDSEFIARMLLCHDDKKYSWREVCTKIGFSGKCTSTVSTKYYRLFANKHPITQKEVETSMNYYKKLGVECFPLQNRNIKQNREIFIQGSHSKSKYNCDWAKPLLLSARNKQLEVEIERCRQEIHELRLMLNSFIQEKEEMKHAEELNPVIHNIKMLLDQAMRNINAKTAARYNPELRKITTLSYITSKPGYNLLHETFGFPTERTAGSYTQKIFNEMFPGVKDASTLFDGSDENVALLIDKFYKKESPNYHKDVVLAIDACSLNSNVRVSPNGSVTGLTNTTKIDVSLAREICNDITRVKFNEFLADHSDEIISATFVVLLIPTDPEYPAFPIYSNKTVNGSATTKIEQSLIELVKTVNKHELNIVGIGCDGDVEWLHFGTTFAQYELSHFTENMNAELFNQYNDVELQLIFYDTLHLGKNLRYYFSTDKRKCIWFTTQNATISKEDFIKCGIDSKLFDDSPKSKCYDDLAIHLFTPTNIVACVDHGRLDLAFALLIMTLLFESIFAEKLSREQRLNYLTIGHAIAFIYLMDLEKYKNTSLPNTYFQREFGGKNTNKQFLYQKSLLIKYLLLTYSLSKQIAQNSPLHLGALGSHLLEHFFGMMRRISNYDQSPEAYDKSLRKIIMYKYLCDELNVDIKSHKRSDSGQKLPEINGDICSISWGTALATALAVLERLNILILSYDELEYITDKYEACPIEDILDFQLHPVEATSKSLRNGFIGKFAGLRRMDRYAVNYETMKAIQEEPKRDTLRTMSQKPMQIRGYYEQKN